MPAPSLEESWTPGKATAGDAVTVLVTRKTPPSSQSLPLDSSAVVGTWYGASMAQNYEGILGSFP